MGRANIISATMPGSPTQWSPIRSFPLNSSSHGKTHCYTKSQGTDIYSLTTKCPFLQRVLAVTVFTDLLANDLFFGGVVFYHLRENVCQIAHSEHYPFCFLPNIFKNCHWEAYQFFFTPNHITDTPHHISLFLSPLSLLLSVPTIAQHLCKQSHLPLNLSGVLLRNV